MSSDVISVVGICITIISMIVTIYYAKKAESIKREIELDIGKLVIFESKDLIEKAVGYARELLNLQSNSGNNRGKKHTSIINNLQKTIDILIPKFGQQNIDTSFGENLRSCSEKLQELRKLNPSDKEFLENSNTIHKSLQKCSENCGRVITKRT